MLVDQIRQLLYGSVQNETRNSNVVYTAIEGALRGFNPVASYITGSDDESQWQRRLRAAETALDPLVEQILPQIRSELRPEKLVGSDMQMVLLLLL